MLDYEQHLRIAEEAWIGRTKAHEKHGQNSIEAVPAGDPRWLPILVEEVGEAASEQTYDKSGSLRAELIDVITVASAWIAAIDEAADAE